LKKENDNTNQDQKRRGSHLGDNPAGGCKPWAAKFEKVVVECVVCGDYSVQDMNIIDKNNDFSVLPAG
jgi:hypothetical protein